jgi:hypothetical protein
MPITHQFVDDRLIANKGLGRGVIEAIQQSGGLAFRDINIRDRESLVREVGGERKQF